MGIFVFLPLALPLIAMPLPRLLGHHLHPRSATRLLAAVGVTLALCSTLCLLLLVVVGTAQLPGNPLPDSWTDPQVRASVPQAEVAGVLAIGALACVLVASARELRAHVRFRARVRAALGKLPADPEVAVLPDASAYAYALAGSPDRIVVSSGMLSSLDTPEQQVLLAHERAHLTHHHHRFVLALRLAVCANPLIHPLSGALGYQTERWADEDAARTMGDRRVTARAVAKAALVTREATASTGPALGAFAARGPVPRRVEALLRPVPASGCWPPTWTPAGLATMVATAGTVASVASAANASIALFVILKAVTTW